MTQEASDRDVDAQMVVACIQELMHDDPHDDRFRIFGALAHHTENLFDKHLRLELAAGQLSDEARHALLGNPAAPFLLAYMVHCLQRFSGTFSDDCTPTTAEKRQALADSFGLVGKPGENLPTMEKRLALGLMFQGMLSRALDAEAAKSSPLSDRAAKAARTSALRQAFQAVYGEAYVYDDDTHKTRMKTLKAQLAHIQAGFQME